MNDFDVAIIGGGPAGAAAAISLAPHVSTILVDRREFPAPKIGESLPPAARPLLRDLGLLEDFEKEGHQPLYGNRSFWGGGDAHFTDFLRDPNGLGWHLDRARFEFFLLDRARSQGACVQSATRLTDINTDGDKWLLDIDTAGSTNQMTAKIILDATGRNATIAKSLGIARQKSDDLICIWSHGTLPPDTHFEGLSTIESEIRGWWYFSPLPEGKFILAFHTDAQLKNDVQIKCAESLLYKAKGLPGLGKIMAGINSIDGKLNITAAHSSFLTKFGGDRWAAIGDAALAFDPISSQGLFNALYTGMFAGQNAKQILQGGEIDFSQYQTRMEKVHQAYQYHLLYWYRAENRWPNAAFWQERHSPSLSLK